MKTIKTSMLKGICFYEKGLRIFTRKGQRVIGIDFIRDSILDEDHDVIISGDIDPVVIKFYENKVTDCRGNEIDPCMESVSRTEYRKVQDTPCSFCKTKRNFDGCVYVCDPLGEAIKFKSIWSDTNA